MDECPHCGEPIEDDAEACPHCGSDFETGWRPDQDYYSVQLPEDDLPPGQDKYFRTPQEIRWEVVLSLFATLAAAALFVWAGAITYKLAMLPFAILLGASGLWFCRLVWPTRGSGR